MLSAKTAYPAGLHPLCHSLSGIASVIPCLCNIIYPKLMIDGATSQPHLEKIPEIKKQIPLIAGLTLASPVPDGVTFTIADLWFLGGTGSYWVYDIPSLEGAEGSHSLRGYRYQREEIQ